MAYTPQLLCLAHCGHTDFKKICRDWTDCLDRRLLLDEVFNSRRLVSDIAHAMHACPVHSRPLFRKRRPNVPVRSMGSRVFSEKR